MEARSTVSDVLLEDAAFRKATGLTHPPDFERFNEDPAQKESSTRLPEVLRSLAPRIGIQLVPVTEFSPSAPQQGDLKYLDFFHPTYVLTYSNTPGYTQGLVNFDSKYQGEFYPGNYVRPAVQLHYPLSASSPLLVLGYVARFFIRLADAKVYRFKMITGPLPSQTTQINFHNAPGDFVLTFTPGDLTAYMILEQQNSTDDAAKWTFFKAVVYRKELVLHQ